MPLWKLAVETDWFEVTLFDDDVSRLRRTDEIPVLIGQFIAIDRPNLRIAVDPYPDVDRVPNVTLFL